MNEAVSIRLFLSLFHFLLLSVLSLLFLDAISYHHHILLPTTTTYYYCLPPPPPPPTHHHHPLSPPPPPPPPRLFTLLRSAAHSQQATLSLSSPPLHPPAKVNLVESDDLVTPLTMVQLGPVLLTAHFGKCAYNPDQFCGIRAWDLKSGLRLPEDDVSEYND
jgi:hypothetical protein